MSAVGSLGPGPSAGSLRANLSGRLDNPDVLAPLLTQHTIVPVPIDAKLSLSRTAQSVRADGVRISVAGQTFEGNATLHTAVRSPAPRRASGVASLDLSPWFGRLPGRSQAGLRLGQARLRCSTTTTTPRIDSAVDPDATDVEGRSFDACETGSTASRLGAKVQSRPDRFVVEPLSLDVAGGTVNARFDVGARGNDPPRIAAYVVAKGLSLQALDAMLGASGAFHGGRAALEASLSLAGDTPRKMAASTSGAVLVSVSNTVLVGAASAIENNVIVSLVHALLPEHSRTHRRSIVRL